VELTRALIVALKIIGSNFIFGIILVLVALSGNLNATVLLAFIIIPMATTLVVFFILEEAEDIAIEQAYAHARALATKNNEYSKDDIFERMKKERESRR
jgi:hypothetical protein